MKLRTALIPVVAVALSVTAFGGPGASAPAPRQAGWQFPKQPSQHVVVSPCSPREHVAKIPAKPNSPGRRG